MPQHSNDETHVLVFNPLRDGLVVDACLHHTVLVPIDRPPMLIQCNGPLRWVLERCLQRHLPARHVLTLGKAHVKMKGSGAIHGRLRHHLPLLPRLLIPPISQRPFLASISFHSKDRHGSPRSARDRTRVPVNAGEVHADVRRRPLVARPEPFELEPMFAPRKAMSISVRHHNQAVMLSQSRVRADGVALEALDWALQEGVISVEQRNCVLREVARRTGKLQRAESSRPGGGMQSFGSSVSLEAFNHRLESFNHRL